jgi:hypothetical protein
MSRPYLHLAINIYSIQPSQPPKKTARPGARSNSSEALFLPHQLHSRRFIAELHKAQSSSFIASVRMHSYACAPLYPRYATVLATVLY